MHNFECFIIIQKGLFIANTICVLIIFRYFAKMKSKNNATYHYLYVILRFGKK